MRPMKPRIFVMSILALAACKGAAKEAPDPAPTVAAEIAAPAAAPAEPAASAPAAATPAPEPQGGKPFEVLAFDAKALPQALEVKGKLVAGARFHDVNGENFVILSMVEKVKEDVGTSIYLHATHHASAGGEVKTLREVKDRSEDCEFDNNTWFTENSLQITDLDKDGMGEVTFAYELLCTSDVSPAELKLLLLEGGDKYIIRGQTTITLPGEEGTIGGEKQVDASFEKGPPEFLKHAEAQWKKLSVHTY
jgi:hypothetical protein